jgi:hypothetical protein
LASLSRQRSLLWAPLPQQGRKVRPASVAPPASTSAQTWQQYLNLPRNQAGLAAGKYTEDDLRSNKFDPTDLNRDGVICVKDVAMLVGSGATNIWQYIYDIVDDDASVPTQ